MKNIFTLFIFFFSIYNIHASTIILHAKNATVWLPQQTIAGEVSTPDIKTVIVHINDSNFSVPVKNRQFIISLLLKQRINVIWVEGKNKQEHITSDTIHFELGYKPLPLVEPFATAKSNKIFLHASVKNNPYNLPLSFFWKADKQNPEVVKISNSHDSDATCLLPKKNGDYYFNVTVVCGKDSVQFQTLVKREDSIHCFNIRTDHAAWIDSSILYEITPYIFVKDGQYNDITKKLPELRSLGINTIWLQPVFLSHSGEQGYDVIDYFSLQPDLGTEKQLQTLITTAKSLHMKVLFDFVPNHTSVFHPYAEDCVLYGKDSHYYNFYQHSDDGAMYSSYYYQDQLSFYHYFWKNLVNLNYQNPEVQQWIIEAYKYWINKFDIDGYRIDAVWALNARDSLFGKQLQLELKSIKPDVLLLAEDKGAKANVYSEGYDAAYDWQADTTWISHWSWQYDYSPPANPTIFNFPNENKRGQMLRDALFTGDSIHLRLRFMENNDEPRFINDHGLARTKMVAAMMFALPGIPLIYDGQEIGCTNKMYSIKPIFKADQSIQSLDNDSLFSYYQQLGGLRMNYKSLRSGNIKNLTVDHSGSIVAFYKWKDDQQFVVIINMSENAQQVNVNISNINKNGNKQVFTDVLSNELFSASANTLNVMMNGYSTRLLLVNNMAFAPNLKKNNTTYLCEKGGEIVLQKPSDTKR